MAEGGTLAFEEKRVFFALDTTLLYTLLRKVGRASRSRVEAAPNVQWSRAIEIRLQLDTSTCHLNRLYRSCTPRLRGVPLQQWGTDARQGRVRVPACIPKVYPSLLHPSLKANFTLEVYWVFPDATQIATQMSTSTNDEAISGAARPKCDLATVARLVQSILWLLVRILL